VAFCDGAEVADEVTIARGGGRGGDLLGDKSVSLIEVFGEGGEQPEVPCAPPPWLVPEIYDVSTASCKHSCKRSCWNLNPQPPQI